MISHLNVDVSFKELEQQIKTSGNNPEILKRAEKTLDRAKGIWKPSAVYRWCEFKDTGSDNSGIIVISPDNIVDFDFGYSIKFLTHARYVLVSVYTAGLALEKESSNASKKGDLMDAYFLDLIGLIVLGKVEKTIKNIVQNKALESGWGVSPFLSPGSVHGWDLSDQIKLCSVLPLEKINVKMKGGSVFSPFKTISCLIGIGPGYDTDKVGTTCQVCSKADNCQMKQI